MIAGAEPTMSPLAWAGFVVAAAIGAPLRYLVDGAIGDRIGGVFPWGTFVINASGSLLLGAHRAGALPRVPEDLQGDPGDRFLRAYTTFSTFSFETVRLVEEGATRAALRNAFGTLVVSGGAAASGWPWPPCEGLSGGFRPAGPTQRSALSPVSGHGAPDAPFASRHAPPR